MYIFKQAKSAILYFDKYPELLKTKLSKVIFYALFFIFLSNFMYSSYPFISYYIETKGFDNFVEKYIPNFKIENEKVIFNKYTKTDTPLGMTFIFDPKENNSITKEDKKDVNENNVILKFTPTHIISSSLNLNMEIAPILKTFNIQNKSDIINMKGIIIMANIIVFIFIVTSFIISDLLGIIMLSLLIGFLAKSYNLKFTNFGLFKLTVYVNTVPYILKLIFFFLGIPMPIFIYIGIILAYLHFIFKAILIESKANQLSAS